MGSKVFRLQWLWHMDLVASQQVESSLTRDRTCAPYNGRWLLNQWTTREVHLAISWGSCFFPRFIVYSGGSRFRQIKDGSWLLYPQVRPHISDPACIPVWWASHPATANRSPATDLLVVSKAKYSGYSNSLSHNHIDPQVSYNLLNTKAHISSSHLSHTQLTN